MIYSVKMAEGKKEEASSVYSCSFSMALVLWILIGSLGNLFIRPLAIFLGATEGNLQLTIEYLRWIISPSGFMVMDLVLNNFMRNEGHPNVSIFPIVVVYVLSIWMDGLNVWIAIPIGEGIAAALAGLLLVRE